MPIEKSLHKPTKKELSVYLFIFESMSSARFQRHMTSLKTLIKSREGYMFEGFNKIADNTYINVVPMLTGMRANTGYNKSFSQSFNTYQSSTDNAGWAEKLGNQDEQAEDEPRYVDEFNPGDQVEHQLFGRGRILDVDGDTVAISFGSKGVKKLNTYLAPIKKV